MNNMKKVLSMILATTAAASMGVTAFAQDTIPNPNNTILSFGDANFDSLLLPGETYSFPLYIAEGGKDAEPVRDSHMKDSKIRAEVKSGKSAVSSFKVEEIDDVYTLEVKTEAGWPTKQTDVEGAIRLVKKASGQAIATAEAAFTVGYNRVLDSSLDAAKEGEYVYVESSAPVITADQFKKLDKYSDGDKVTFTNGSWRYETRVSDQESVNLLHNERTIKEIATAYEDQSFKYVSFPAGPEFAFNGTLTIDVSEEMNEFEDSFYAYRYYKGKLSKMDAKLDKEDGSLSLTTNTLGRFVITNKEIKDGTIIEAGYVPETEKPSDNNNSDNNNSDNNNSNSNNSGSTTTKPNPSTGANDMVAIAAAALALSLVGAGVLASKKSK